MKPWRVFCENRGRSMPFLERVDHDARLVRIAVSGTFSLTDMTTTVDRVSAAAGKSVGWSVLSDHRAIAAPASTPQLENLVEHIRRSAPVFHGQRWAVITGSKASFRMMRMLSVLAQRVPIEVAVFKDPAEAEAWLAAQA